MKIISFRAENVKRLVAVSITPDGNIVEITGKNGAGKTSVLDSIWWALCGPTAVQKSPIRNGCETAFIELDLGKLKITRTFTAKKEGGHTTKLTVENEDGMRFQTPQAILDAIYGELTFDPLAFTRQKPKEQFDTLKQFVPGIDFDVIDKANDDDFKARTDINRRAKEFRAQAAGVVVPEIVGQDPVDEAALITELAGAGEFNTGIERMKAQRAAAATAIANLDKSALAHRSRAIDLRAQADMADATAAGDEQTAAAQRQTLAALEEIPAPKDTTELSAKIAEARKKNEMLADAERAAKSAATLAASAEAEEAKADALTKAITDRTTSKENAIAAATIPVAGLTFGDRIVLLGGVPFEQASDAEQLRASVELAAAMNPRLRIIRVRDGSLLDENSMKILAEIADKADMQVWIETVDSGRAGAVVMEDGHVAGAVQQAAE